MKRISIWSMLAIPLIAACEMLGDGSSGKEGELRVKFDDVPPDDTRSSVEIPDTNDFLLYVADSKGNVIYDGTYGDAPEAVMVKAGSYNVRVHSCSFEEPAFSSPQFGDEQCVVVRESETAHVRLLCSQVNSGIRLIRSSDFLSAYPDASLLLKSSAGTLVYSHTEKRIAYFPSGNVSLMLSRGSEDKTLMTRWMEPGEMLSLNVGVSSGHDAPSMSDAGEFSISLDTSRVWVEEKFVIGHDGRKGDSAENAMGITQAISSVGEKQVWISGYVVGGDLSSTSASFEEPFTSRTNIAIGPKSSTVNRMSCIAVQLQSGSVRDNLNLVDNPEILGERICLKGDIVASYFGLVGIKNVSDYVLE